VIALADTIGGDIEKYRDALNSALVLGGTHIFEDIVAEVAAETMQFWSHEKSCIVTQIINLPRLKLCFLFLGAGELAGIEILVGLVTQWARDQGCTRMEFIGRPGWERTFLNRTGWTTTAICMEKPL
jgi:hypothetical protein